MLQIWTSYIGRLVHTVGRVRVDGGIIFLASITLLEYMKIWCNILIIYIEYMLLAALFYANLYLFLQLY